MKTVKERDSNIELLRIIAIIMVMMGHALFRACGAPSAEQIASRPDISFLRCFAEALIIIAVNVFVFISGWYGIKANLKKLCSLIFQVLFAIWVINAALLIMGEPMSLKLMLRSVFMTQYWFIQAYFVLFVFSPVLNSFLESSSEKELFGLLGSFLIIQLLWGWLPMANNRDWFDYGYSPLSFFFLYMLAGYIHKYRWHQLEKYSAQLWFSVYLMLSLVLSLLAFGELKYGLPLWLLGGGHNLLLCSTRYHVGHRFLTCIFKNEIQMFGSKYCCKVLPRHLYSTLPRVAIS